MNGPKQRRTLFYIALAAAIVLVAGGVLMLGRTFTHYNELSQQRQDDQLLEMAQAADESIAVQLNNIQTNLSYVLKRRGFIQAELTWAESGETTDLLFRMQENLITQNPLIHAMLALKDGEVFLSTSDSVHYSFPVRREGALQPCFAGDGTMYLALLEQTEHAEYAALIDVATWYADLVRVNAGNGSRLMLLGSREKLLLHQWPEETHVTAVEELKEDNCDIQAVRYMMTSRTTGESLTETYHLTYPEDSFVHEMRMTVIPLEEGVNGYFIVGLIGDYDEIVRPMNAAAVQLIIFGSMIVVGMLLLLFMAMNLIRQGRRQDQELEKLLITNAQTQALLEKTQQLAHHQRLETLGTLASSIAHEFNNLLTPIMGYSILTLEGLPEGSDDLADNITEIYEASRKAKTIISRLSALARKNEETTFAPLSLDELVSKALVVAAPAQPAHVETVTHLNCGGYRLLGSETQLSQLLLNLVINAFHAMEDKGGTLTLSTSMENAEVVLRVEDTGTGIPDEALPHVFEPFFSTKETGRGTGLGLAIVRQVVESHQGQIQVDSQVGAGTVFTLRFPLAEASPLEP